MAAISIGDALGEGFGLIGRRPLAVLAWGLARTLFVGATMALMAPFYLLMFSRFASLKSGVAPAPPDLTSMMQAQGIGYLLGFGGIFVGVVVSCAVFRSVLHPELSRFAYLRVGMAELFLFVLLFGAQIVMFIAALVAVIPIALLAAAMVAAHAAGAAILVAVLGGFAALALLIWVVCRLALIGPMTVADGKFHLFDAWALTRGHGGALFLIGLCLMVIVILIEAVLGAIVLALGLGFMSQMAGGLGHLQAFFTRPPAEVIASLSPALVVMALLSIPVSGALMAILAAPWARAYRDLAPPDVAATFA